MQSRASPETCRRGQGGIPGDGLSVNAPRGTGGVSRAELWGHGDGSSAVRWRNPGPRPLPAIEAWTDMWQTHMLARSPAARDQDYFPGGGRPGMHTANCASGAGPGAAGHFLGSSARLEPPRRVGPSHDPRSRAAETVRLFAN